METSQQLYSKLILWVHSELDKCPQNELTMTHARWAFRDFHLSSPVSQVWAQSAYKFNCIWTQVAQFYTLANSIGEIISDYVRGKAYSEYLSWRVVFKGTDYIRCQQRTVSVTNFSSCLADVPLSSPDQVHCACMGSQTSKEVCHKPLMPSAWWEWYVTLQCIRQWWLR